MEISGNHRYQISRLFKSVITAISAIAVISFFHFHTTSVTDDEVSIPDRVSAVDESAGPFAVASSVESAVKTPIKHPVTLSFPPQVQRLIDAGDYQQARAILLAMARDAVDQGDQNALATSLATLGELSMQEEDVDAAEVYLTEALDVFAQLQAPIETAAVYGQIGRLHLLVRERARRASSAYDTLLIARWKISHGQFYSAESDLKLAAKSNMDLKRYGAAASAYETLYRGYMEVSDFYQAQLAGVEAIRLHASSGRLFDAEALQQKMLAQGIDQSVFDNLAPELALLVQEFEDSVKAIGTARDQAQLYNQLKARGDIVNAWRFRQQADASLANASSRAQYRRQPDVLAELYRSNNSMKNARDSLRRADELFQKHGVDTTELQMLQSLIY